MSEISSEIAQLKTRLAPVEAVYDEYKQYYEAYGLMSAMCQRERDLWEAVRQAVKGGGG